MTDNTLRSLFSAFLCWLKVCVITGEVVCLRLRKVGVGGDVDFGGLDVGVEKVAHSAASDGKVNPVLALGSHELFLLLIVGKPSIPSRSGVDVKGLGEVEERGWLGV